LVEDHQRVIRTPPPTPNMPTGSRPAARHGEPHEGVDRHFGDREIYAHRSISIVERFFSKDLLEVYRVLES